MCQISDRSLHTYYFRIKYNPFPSCCTDHQGGENFKKTHFHITCRVSIVQIVISRAAKLLLIFLIYFLSFRFFFSLFLLRCVHFFYFLGVLWVRISFLCVSFLISINVSIKLIQTDVSKQCFIHNLFYFTFFKRFQD